MVQSLNSNLKKILAILLLVGFGIAYCLISNSIPISGDGSFHASVTESITHTGEIPTTHPYIISDGTAHLPLFYPKLFYIETAELRLLMGPSVYKLIVPIFGILAALLVFLLVSKIFKNEIIGLAALFTVLISPGLINNAVPMFRMETMITFLLFGGFYSLWVFRENKDKRWFFISVALFGAALSTKQIAYIAAPLYILLTLIRFSGNLKYRLGVAALFLFTSVVIAAPVLANEFIDSGTLFYPGVPFVSTIEKVLTSTTHINTNKIGSGWTKYALQSSRSNSDQQQYHSLSGHIDFLSPFADPGSDAANTVLVDATIMFFILGAAMLISWGEYYILGFMLLQEIMLYKFPLDRYFLINQIFAAMIIGVGGTYLLVKKGLHKNIAGPAVMGLFVVIALLSGVLSLYWSAQTPNYSYGHLVPDNTAKMAAAGYWIRDNTPSDSVVISPRANDITYFAQRNTLWLNQVGGQGIYEAFLNNDAGAIYKISKTYPHAYIVIPQYWVVQGSTRNDWISFIQQSSVDAISSQKNEFAMAYKNDLITIYKVQ